MYIQERGIYEITCFITQKQHLLKKHYSTGYLPKIFLPLHTTVPLKVNLPSIFSVLVIPVFQHDQLRLRKTLKIAIFIREQKFKANLVRKHVLHTVLLNMHTTVI